MVLLSAQGVKLRKGTLPVKLPYLSKQTVADTRMATKRFENTQNAAEGNLPVGLSGVGLKFLFIINSCMMPHIL
jgi:hypothetical protein